MKFDFFFNSIIFLKYKMKCSFVYCEMIRWYIFNVMK